MKIKAFFLPQGLVVGEVISESYFDEPEQKEFTVKNPALVIARQNTAVLVPLLHLVDEDEIVVKLKDVAFKSVFTPQTEVINHYNQIYGSGLVLANTLPL